MPSNTDGDLGRRTTTTGPPSVGRKDGHPDGDMDREEDVEGKGREHAVSVAAAAAATDRRRPPPPPSRPPPPPPPSAPRASTQSSPFPPLSAGSAGDGVDWASAPAAAPPAKDTIHERQPRRCKLRRRLLVLGGMAIALFRHGIKVKLDSMPYNSVAIARPSANPTSAAEAPSARSLPPCTWEEYVRENYPAGRAERDDVTVAQEILAHIMSKPLLSGAPFAIMFGTMLYDVRNGTDGPCLKLNLNDKDIDVAVFPLHLLYINTLKDEIMEKFGWKLGYDEKMERGMITTIWPGHGKRHHYQIDFYGIQCNKGSDLIHFPWDRITIARNSYLPLRRHKSALLRDRNATYGAEDPPTYYIPRDHRCLLKNLYGHDYMTPRSGPESQAKWGTQHDRPAHGNPECDSGLNAHEEWELEQQLAFC